MNVGEVYNLFRSLVDETDETFLTPANTDTYLKSGYSDFRQKVSVIAPDYYIERTHLTIPPNTGAVSLSTGGNFSDGNPILGAGAVAANKLMSRVMRIGKVDSAANDQRNYYLVPCNSSIAVQRGEGDYTIANETLVLGSTLVGTVLRIEYLRDPVIAWTSASAAYIDDLAPHHPLIALYAAQYYAIRDGAFNEPLQVQLARKERELEAALTTGRLADGAQYITPQRSYFERY